MFHVIDENQTASPLGNESIRNTINILTNSDTK